MAQPIGYGLGLLNSYIFNKRWTFQAKSDHSDIVRFLLVNGLTFGLNSLVLWIAYDALGIHEWISKGIATVVTLAANYVGYSRWVFRDR
jgi:putative flippase GtrA